MKSAGYHAAVYGQKTYNGVAILSRSPLENVVRGLNDGVEDPQARLLAATIDGVRVVCVYVPNGAEVGNEKEMDLQARVARALAYLARDHEKPDQPLALCGDYNVALDDRDVHDPAAWAETVLCHPKAREAIEKLRAWGLEDVFRKHRPEAGIYSWWDYRDLGFPRNKGLRIDHIFATPPLAARSTEASVDREERKGKLPSDHAPVQVTFA